MLCRLREETTELDTLRESIRSIVIQARDSLEMWLMTIQNSDQVCRMVDQGTSCGMVLGKLNGHLATPMI